MVNDGFIKDQETQSCTLVNPRVFVTDQKLTTMQDILPVLEASLGVQAPLLIMVSTRRTRHLPRPKRRRAAPTVRPPPR